MKRGLVIGKFMPIHQGHIALINFAATQCDEVIVSMSYTAQDPIAPELRFSWIKEIFQHSATIQPHSIQDDFDNESLPWTARTKIWADVIRKVYPRIDILFSSEVYGEPFAQNLGAEHQSFDPDRKLFPVSATCIRAKPFSHWSYIPEVVRPHFVKRVCFYGPESTGKSTMAKHMAALFNTEYAPEVARELLTSNDFTVEDIIRIGHAHTQRVLDKTKKANKILFCDTDLITTQIYSRHYLGVVPPVLYELEKTISYDLYFLFDVDVPWVSDGLRDLGGNRNEMLEVFTSELKKRNHPYVLVHGTWEERENLISARLNSLD
ncbi:MAG: AAA family ATPase [Cyclobacteriaceae bacterium]|nr:AAA family ATPase [Cyclobacteriaceae bacterium]